MSGRMSRNKGARGEREVFALLNEQLGQEHFKRNLTQTRAGGCDAETSQRASIFSMEVKRGEQLNLRSAIQQAIDQAKPGQLPVLAYRRNGEAWRFLIISDLKGFADLFDVIAGT
jgi:Holliday junction resolvase